MRLVGFRLLCAAIVVLWCVPLIVLCQAPSILRVLLALPSLFLTVVCILPAVDFLRFGVYVYGSRVIEDVETKGCWTWIVVGTLFKVALGNKLEGPTLWPCLFIVGQVIIKKKQGEVIVDGRVTSGE